MDARNTWQGATLRMTLYYEDLGVRVPAATADVMLESLRDFVAQRVAMTDYPRFRQRGYDGGSGPTESQCGTPTDRLKGLGMRWDKSNAEAMRALACLSHSGLWDTYWKAERAAA